MGIISTCLFSDPSESNLLWVKLNVEQQIVEKWIIVEGAFSHKGVYKGSCLRKVLDEPRFLQFSDRIQIITCNQNLLLLANSKDPDFGLAQVKAGIRKLFSLFKKQIVSLFILTSMGLTKLQEYRREKSQHTAERRYHEAEKMLRNQALEAICETASSEDWIFVCDVDEILDGETLSTKEFFLDLSKNSYNFPSIVRIRVRQRLWDFDNLNSNANLSRVLVKAQLLIENILNVGQVRISRTYGWWPKLPIEGIHEYSSCLSRAGIEKKFETYVHLPDSRENLENALFCNTTLSYGGEPHFLQKVDAELDHQPVFVKSNIDSLRTNLVSKHFEYNRRRVFHSRIEYSNRVSS